jgi:ABC-2 type transport system ATP-binding protein
LTEDNDLPGWMRVDELMRYMRPFYPNWSDAYAEELRQAFALEPGVRIKELSKGQRARVGLLIALAYRPALLVLDEPSAGLDPLVRRDILGAIVRTIADEGRTVLFSSHLLDEVERVADHVAMIHRGRIVFDAPLDEIRATHRRLTVRFPEPRPRPPALAGVLAWEGSGREWSAVCAGAAVGFRAAAEATGGAVVAEQDLGLNEIFVARAAAVVARAEV